MTLAIQFIKTRAQTVPMTRAQISRLGGQAGKGASKARTSEQARDAVNARWNKYRLERAQSVNNV